jgi:hypothetical protein
MTQMVMPLGKCSHNKKLMMMLQKKMMAMQ